MPPQHIHRDHDEVFLVTQGKLCFTSGAESVDVEAGSCVTVPAGTAHTFQGSEASVVIFDLVIDEPHWRVGLMINAYDENNKRLLNVAMTRARDARSFGRRAGFSLPEMLIVLVILGIIAAFATPAIASTVRHQRVNKAAALIASRAASFRSGCV